MNRLFSHIGDVMEFNWEYLISQASNKDFWSASILVAWLSILTWIIGSCIGLFVALARTTGPIWLQRIAGTYIWFFRSLPLLVLLIFVYNLPQAMPGLQPILSNPFWAGLIALVISETAYLAEIHRGGLLSVDNGQHEAARALGIKPFGKYRYIIVPQSIRVSLPSLGNQFITIVKLTSLVSVISLAEVLLVGQRLYTRNFLVIETLVAVSCYYVLIVSIFSYLLGKVEKKLDVNQRQTYEISPESLSNVKEKVSIRQRCVGTDVLINLKSITKSFGSKVVLNQIDLKVHAGEVISIIGPSGSGKTTLIRTINTLQDIDSGRIDFNGNIWISNSGEYTVAKSFYEEVTHIGMVFQSFNLFPHMTVLENVSFGPRYHSLGTTEEIRVNTMHNLEKMGMSAHASKYPHQLSGGQKQRVAIARALAMRPKVMLFDEPTSALDPELVDEVLQAIELLASEGMTMIIVTHEMRFARRVSDRIVMMENGVIVADKSVSQINEESSESRIRRFMLNAQEAH